MVACRVCWCEPGFLGVGDADESECRVGRGRPQFPLERQKAAADDIRLGGVELVGEAFEAIALVGYEVYLQWGGFTDASTCHGNIS